MLEGWRQGAWCNNISFARFKIVNNQNIIASDNYLFVYKILDLAKLMLLNSIVKLNYVTQKDFLVMIPASTLIKKLFFIFHALLSLKLPIRAFYITKINLQTSLIPGQGPSILYRGFGSCIYRAFVVNSVVLFVYTQISNYFQEVK